MNAPSHELDPTILDLDDHSNVVVESGFSMMQFDVLDPSAQERCPAGFVASETDPPETTKFSLVC